MPNNSVLIVEDEADILELIQFNLQKEGYQTKGVKTGEEALKSVKISQPDIILLDLMLPGIDGLEVCKTLKSNPQTKNIPIIMLTAKTEESDIVIGLELGADDYITKPFSPKVLMARIKAVLRRNSSNTNDSSKIITIKDVTIDPIRFLVTVRGEEIDLTHTEFRILHFLASQPGRVFSRYQIVDAVHGTNYSVTDRSIDVQIVGLRKKLKDAGYYIQTVRGVGYRFKEP